MPIFSKFKKTLSFEGDDAKVVQDAVNKMNEMTGLKEKGLRIKFLNPLKEKAKEAKQQGRKCKEGQGTLGYGKNQARGI